MKGWHFCRADRRLGYGDGRLIEAGKTLRVDVEPELCVAGLHASERAIDALAYAPGLEASYVELSGVIKTDNDKACATERHTYWVMDAAEVVLEWACWCARRHLDKWDAPNVVTEFLSNPSTAVAAEAARVAARAVRAAEAAQAAQAAWAAAEAAQAAQAAWAAWAAAEAAEAAEAAARSAGAAAEANEAAWAAWAAEHKALNSELERRLLGLAP